MRRWAALVILAAVGLVTGLAHADDDVMWREKLFLMRCARFGQLLAYQNLQRRHVGLPTFSCAQALRATLPPLEPRLFDYCVRACEDPTDLRPLLERLCQDHNCWP